MLGENDEMDKFPARPIVARQEECFINKEKNTKACIVQIYNHVAQVCYRGDTQFLLNFLMLTIQVKIGNLKKL